MCGSRLWTIAAFLCSAYFASIAIERARSSNVAWSHDALDIATHGIWVLFMFGLIAETRCWKERVFFAIVLVNFGLASAMGVWNSASLAAIDDSRMVSAALWAVAALVSLGLVFARGDQR
jgi:hypothetical protein